MEWSIIVAVLCLIATPATSVTNQTATPVTNQTATPVTNQTATPVTNQTATPVTNQTATPVTNQTATPVTNQTATSVTNQTATPVTNQTATPVMNQTATPVTNQTATPATNQTATPATNQTATSVTNQTATPATNQTATSVTNQTATPVTNQTATPVTNQTASPVMNQTASPVMNQTASPVTNQTATPVTTVSAPAKVAQTKLGFSINQEFKDIYSDLSNTETKELSNRIINECSRVYKRRFPKFYRMLILKFSKGSILVDSVLEFDSTNGTSPNVTEVKDTLVTAVTNGTFNFTINNSSINTTDIPETSATTPATTPNTNQTATPVTTSNLTDYNITFKLNDNFEPDLSNMTSDAATKLAKNITSELDGFCKGFKNFMRSLVWRFRSGSIVVDGQLGFNNSLANNPTVIELARGLAEAVRNGKVKLSVDPKSITVTDSSGKTANRSPVLASMLTALWMTLASLLLSAVMH